MPIHRALPVVRLIWHVAPKRRVVTEHYILQEWFARTGGLEKIAKVRFQIVIVISAIAFTLRSRLAPGFRIMLVVPLFEVSVPQPTGKSVAIITGRQVDPRLRRVAQSELGKLKNSLRSPKT